MVCPGTWMTVIPAGSRALAPWLEERGEVYICPGVVDGVGFGAYVGQSASFGGVRAMGSWNAWRDSLRLLAPMALVLLESTREGGWSDAERRTIEAGLLSRFTLTDLVLNRITSAPSALQALADDRATRMRCLRVINDVSRWIRREIFAGVGGTVQDAGGGTQRDALIRRILILDRPVPASELVRWGDRQPGQFVGVDTAKTIRRDLNVREHRLLGGPRVFSLTVGGERWYFPRSVRRADVLAYIARLPSATPVALAA